MLTNAQATTKGAIMLLTNFIFISVISFRCLAFRALSSLRTHFGPFTEVLRKIRSGVTRKLRAGVISRLTLCIEFSDGKEGAVSELPASRSRKRHWGANSLIARLSLHVGRCQACMIWP